MERPQKVSPEEAREAFVKARDQFVADVGKAFAEVMTRIIESIQPFFKQVAIQFNTLYAILSPMLEMFYRRYVIEHMGITEADIKRIDLDNRQVICWNRRRYDLPAPEVMMEKMQRD